MVTREAVTSLLVSAEAGDEVWERLVPLVYEELRALARLQLAGEAPATLSTTALVHEAFLRLVDSDRVITRGRAYFFGAAARAMRQILVDHARQRQSLRRAGIAVTLRSELASIDAFAADVLDLDSVLEQLARLYPRQARVVECRFFAGLSIDETADVLGVSPRTVKGDWALARAWLHRELHSSRDA